MNTPRTLVVCSIVAAGLLTTQSSIALETDRELRFPLPRLSPVVNPSQTRCEAVVSTGLYANTIGEKGILAQLARGTDKISIEVDGDVLYFLTGAGFNLGGAKGAKFQVLHNSEQQILAITSEGGKTVDVFTLNKKTGLAVWTKTRFLDFMSGGNPSAQSFYLMCR